MSRRRVAFAYGSQAMFDLILSTALTLFFFVLCGVLLWWLDDSSPDY